MSLTGPGLNVSVKFTTQLFIIHKTIIIITLRVDLCPSCNRLFHWYCRMSRPLAVPGHLRFYARCKIGCVNSYRFLVRQVTSPSCRICLHGKKEIYRQIFMPQEEFEPALSTLEQQQTHIFRSYYCVIKDNGMLFNTHETTWNS